MARKFLARDWVVKETGVKKFFDKIFLNQNAPFATITGTTLGATESQVVAADTRTIIITLTGAEWVATGAAFDAQRQNIIDGLNLSVGDFDDTGFVAPGTMAGDRSITSGTINWTLPDNAKVDNGSVATASLTGGTASNGLAASNFDFTSIDTGRTILGIEAQVGDYDRDAGSATWNSVRLILADNSDGTGDKKATLLNPIASLQTDVVGDIFDVWGAVLTTTDVKDVDFGFFIGAVDGGGSTDLRVDFMALKVYYAADLGWEGTVRDTMDVSRVARTSNTVVTITLNSTETADYKIVADEVITVTVPSTALVSAVGLIGNETVNITAECDQTLAPDTIATQTNLTGTVTDIDESVDAPDGNWLIMSPP